MMDGCERLDLAANRSSSSRAARCERRGSKEKPIAETCAKPDLVQKPAAFLLLWGLPAVLMALSASFAQRGGIIT